MSHNLLNFFVKITSKNINFGLVNYAILCKGASLGKKYSEIMTTINLITPGQLAPDFELKDINGNVVRLSSFRGSKPIVLTFLRGFM